MYLGLGLRLTGRLGSGGRVNNGVTLAASAVSRGATLAAQPVANRLRMWSNDPASADRVGRYRAGGPAAPLSDAAFASIFGFIRSSKAWDVDANGALTEIAANAIRQGYGAAGPAGWLLEGAAQNSVRNSRGEGSVVGVLGSGGAWPTYWSGGGPGLTVEIVGKGVEDGLAYNDIRFSGIPTLNGGSYYTIGPEPGPGIIVAANGQLWTPSAYIRRLSGPAPLYSRAYLRQYNAANGALADLFPAVTIPTTGTIGNCRVAPAAQTLNQATTASIGFFYQFGTLNDGTTSIDVVYRVAGPQLEQNYLASSLILPPIGAPAAASRTGEALWISGNTFAAIFGAGAPQGFVICDVMLPQSAALGVAQGIFEIDDGTNSNRFLVRNDAGTTAVQGWRVTGNAGSGAANTGNLTPGVPFRVGMAWAGGVARFCGPSGTIVTHTGGPTGGFTALRVGSADNGGVSAPNGRILNLWAGAASPADTPFRNACALGADPVAVLA